MGRQALTGRLPAAIHKLNPSDLISDFPADRLIIWAGAGVSYPRPSSLPLGIPLTEFALRQCCGGTVASRVLELWGEVNRLVGTAANPAPLGTAPRLESVLGDIDDVRDHAADFQFDFLRGFRAFAAAPFNQNHLFIADLIRSGASIVTTNFDACIEEAYRWLTGGADEMAADTDSATPCFRPRSAASAARVWHVHGAAEDVRSLGATVRAVKEGLRQDFRDWLDGALHRGTLVIFVGYGAGDSFDINLHFADRGEREFGESAGWFVQHPGAPTPRGTALLLGPFGRKLITTEDTTERLMTLSGAGSGPAPAPPFHWDDVFLRHAVMRDRGEVAGYLICRLSFSLGVNVDLLDETAYANALRAEWGFRAEDFHTTLAYVCRVRGESRLEKQHDLLSRRGGVELLGYYYSKGDVRRALKYSKSIDELFADASRGTELGWETYTSMSAHCRAAVSKKLANPFAKQVASEDRSRMERLVGLTDLLGGVSLRNVRYINQVATALRFNFLLRAILHGEDGDEAVNRVLFLYGEGASVAGFISTYRDAALMHFFLAKYHRKNSMRKASDYVQRSLRVAEAVGDVPSIKRARKLGALLTLHSLFLRGTSDRP